MIYSLLALLLFATPGFTASDCTDSFRRAGIAVPQALLKKGYRRFGNLDLQRFVAEAKRVKIVPSTSGTVWKKNKRENQNYGRASGRWSNGQITVACDFFTGYSNRAATSASAIPFAFHEFLGALKYSDAEYRGSIALWLLSRDDAHRLLREGEKNKIETWATAMLNGGDGGGVVGVGGGGEIGTVYIRTKRLTEDLAKLKRKPRERERLETIDWIYDHLTSTATFGYGTP